MSRAKAETAKRLPGLPDEPWAYLWSSEKYRAAMRESFAKMPGVPPEDVVPVESHPPERKPEPLGDDDLPF